ncbi:MAG: hypothetical protein CMP11_03275 [Zetaproteobacteria bacterium]|nr:hypothetical protein [Pseudobdellovibrionaceae bacterium]|tara:strand:- start:1120 stop:1650 length:531 start_codon:yes stop_codon:yes gene_type:complete
MTISSIVGTIAKFIFISLFSFCFNSSVKYEGISKNDGNKYHHEDRKNNIIQKKKNKIKRYGGYKINKEKLKSFLKNAGFKDSEIPVMLCIAKWESSFYNEAYNKNLNGSNDYGLFQINDRWWVGGKEKKCPNSPKELFDPVVNTKCARAIYKIQGFRAWQAFKVHCNHKNHNFRKT